MSKTVNIMGDTPKQQWLNAIQVFETCIYENTRMVHDHILDWNEDEHIDDYNTRVECLETAMRNTKNFADEMRRLVEGVFNDD